MDGACKYERGTWMNFVGEEIKVDRIFADLVEQCFVTNFSGARNEVECHYMK